MFYQNDKKAIPNHCQIKETKTNITVDGRVSVTGHALPAEEASLCVSGFSAVSGNNVPPSFLVLFSFSNFICSN